MFIANWKVGTRLALGFGILILIAAVSTAVGISRMRTLNDSIDLIVNDREPKVALANNVLNAINATAIGLRNLLMTDDPEKLAALHARIDTIHNEASASVAELGRRLNTPRGIEVFRQLETARAEYWTVQAEYLALLTQGKKTEAAAFLLDRVTPPQEKYIAQASNLAQLGARLMTESSKLAADQYRIGVELMFGLAAASMLLAAAFAYWVTRSITTPLRAAVQIASTVASGDLRSRIEARSADETGDLMRALAAMNRSLTDIVRQVRGGTDSIAAASTQIASGNLDLSSRTEQQAASLEETASSMEQLTSTVRQNAENARQANQMALSASDAARHGGAVIDNVVSTMSAIHASSKKMAEIISVIDGIAFQTNILALNAAVEAARAGEQGRGFAVVASEVRNLAQRSSKAAREIKLLIDDSAREVAAGNQHVSAAGATMESIVNSVRKVTDIVAEIAAASEEQQLGIGQAYQAITAMDGVTQQNAALVEQAAAAAQSLQDQAATLLNTVSTFTLEAEPPALAGGQSAPAATRVVAMVASTATAPRLAA